MLCTNTQFTCWSSLFCLWVNVYQDRLIVAKLNQFFQEPCVVNSLFTSPTKQLHFVVSKYIPCAYDWETCW
jgi:hypothetical protein